jgi:hypothetical protein
MSTANLDRLALVGGGNSLVLGTNAAAAFTGNVSIAAGSAGGDSIDLSGLTTKPAFVDGSASALGNTITGGAAGSCERTQPGSTVDCTGWRSMPSR